MRYMHAPPSWQWNWWSGYLFVPVVAMLVAVSCGQQDIHPGGFRIGDDLFFECLNSTGEWEPGPVCHETNEPLAFKFGVDSFAYCGLAVPDNNTFQHMESWQCRIPMAPDRKFFLPLSIPLWGIMEPDHFHLDNHLNFIFHVAHARIIGAAAYPVRDRFQFGGPGTVVHMHGPFRWFRAHTYSPFSMYGSSDESRGAGGFLAGSASGAQERVLLFLGALLGAAFAWLSSIVIYRLWLRPRLLRKLVEGKQD